MEGMIDITGIDLVKAVQEAYALSSPQGLGYLHYQEGGLTEDEAREFVHEDNRCPVSLDYVKGRSCKVTVFKREGKLFIRSAWYDHSEAQLKELLARLGVKKGVENANS